MQTTHANPGKARDRGVPAPKETSDEHPAQPSPTNAQPAPKTQGAQPDPQGGCHAPNPQGIQPRGGETQNHKRHLTKQGRRSRTNQDYKNPNIRPPSRLPGRQQRATTSKRPSLIAARPGHRTPKVRTAHRQLPGEVAVACGPTRNAPSAKDEPALRNAPAVTNRLAKTSERQGRTGAAKASANRGPTQAT